MRRLNTIKILKLNRKIVIVYINLIALLLNFFLCIGINLNSNVITFNGGGNAIKAQYLFLNLNSLKS